MTCILEKEDYLVLESLIKTSESIEEIYHHLFRLELIDQKDSLEYQKYFDYLKIAIEVENRIYEENDFNTSKCSAFLGVLNDTFKGRFHTAFDSISIKDFKNASLYRVYNVINNRIYENDDIDDEEIDENPYSTFIINMLEKETCLLLLSKIASDKKLSQTNIIRIKYYLSFVNNKLENELIDSVFNVSNSVFVHSYLYANIYGEGDKYSSLVNFYCYSGALYEIRHILAFNDNDLFKKNDNVIVRLEILKAYLALADDETMADVNDYLNNLVYDKHLEDKIIVERLKNLFINIQKTREKLLLLKLGK